MRRIQVNIRISSADKDSTCALHLCTWKNGSMSHLSLQIDMSCSWRMICPFKPCQCMRYKIHVLLICLKLWHELQPCSQQLHNELSRNLCHISPCTTAMLYYMVESITQSYYAYFCLIWYLLEFFRFFSLLLLQYSCIKCHTRKKYIYELLGIIN